MVAGATLTAGGTKNTTEGDTKKAPMPVVPFIRASGLHRELVVDTSRAVTTSDQDLGPFDIPAYGYMRSLRVVVTESGGAGTTVTLTEDAPWNSLKNISVIEPNGATLYSVSSGYSAYLISKWGGYRWSYDPRSLQSYSVAVGSSMNASYEFRIPIELSERDALGSLPNQNAAATFKLKFTLAKVSDPFAGTLTTPPTARIRVYLEAYDQPDLETAGQTNQTTPPAMNTTQFWSEQQYAYNSGQFNVRLTRMGNYIREWIMIPRRTSGTRANGDSDFPDPVTLYLDTRAVDLIEKTGFYGQMQERTGYGNAAGTGATSSNKADVSQNALDPGVFVYDFAHEFSGKIGMENRDLWLPTLASSRVEWGGSWGNAGTLTVLTNDVAPVGNIFL